MAKFLTAKACTSEIEEMVRQADEKIWLISPYLDIDRNLKERLESKDRAGIDMRLIYRGKRLPDGEIGWLNSLDSLTIASRASLHAKCYMNEDAALITSLNLYEYSQVNNDEWGILVSREEDADLYQRIADEADLIFQNSVVEKRSRRTPARKTPTAEDNYAETVKLVQEIAQAKREMEEGERREQRRGARTPAKASGKPALPKTGVCIRGGESIGFDVLKPYCYKCFKSRTRRDENYVFTDNACHACGRDCPTGIGRPLCLDCLRQYGGLLAAQGRGLEVPDGGACIRDGNLIGFDLSKPFCDKCFRSWNRYKKRDYQESMCHNCGGKGPASMSRPICVYCYLMVEYVSVFHQVLGDDYVPWTWWEDGDDVPW